MAGRFMEVSLTVKAYGEQTSLHLSDLEISQHTGLLQDLKAVLQKHLEVTKDAEAEDVSESFDMLDNMTNQARKVCSLPEPRAPKAPEGRPMKKQLSNHVKARRTKRMEASNLQELLREPAQRTERILDVEVESSLRNLAKMEFGQRRTCPGDSESEVSEDERSRNSLPSRAKSQKSGIIQWNQLPAILGAVK
ncbi:unnamed protein product [Effrenium voratum]|nr:unnamed protein product [Effrenium voratum]